jgi:hypothetical protein
MQRYRKRPLRPHPNPSPEERELDYGISWQNSSPYQSIRFPPHPGFFEKERTNFKRGPVFLKICPHSSQQVQPIHFVIMPALVFVI